MFYLDERPSIYLCRAELSRVRLSRLWCTVILVISITSRDLVAIMLLYRLIATFSHRTWFASDFSSSTFSKNDRKSQMTLFAFFCRKKKCSFIFVSCTRKRHSTLIEDYIERRDVIVEISFHSLLIRRAYVTWFDLTQILFYF
jgi:hypothetical protein